MATTESQNRELVRRCVRDVLTEGNLDRMDEYFAEDYVEHTTAVPGDIEGLPATKEHYATIREAMPDFEVEIEELIADEDKVVQRSLQTGTHEGQFLDIEPTGNRIDSPGIVIYRIEDGKIVEAWVQANMMGMLQQLGVVELPGKQSDEAGRTAPATRENKQLVQRFIRELVNGKSYDLADELFTADYTRHDPNTPGDEQGPEPFIEELKGFHEGFPDSEVHVGEIIAEGDLVAFEGTMTGTHENTFRGVEPTNTSIEVSGNAMHRIRDGRIAETWATWNFLGVFQQLGAVEPPAE